MKFSLGINEEYSCINPQGMKPCSKIGDGECGHGRGKERRENGLQNVHG